MEKVEDALEKGSGVQDHGMVLEDDPEYRYSELQCIFHHPIDYARVVKKIGNEMDLTLVDMEGLLPAAIRMVISVTASTTSGKPLPEEVLQKTIEACDRALALDSAKKQKLEWVTLPKSFCCAGSAVACKTYGNCRWSHSLGQDACLQCSASWCQEEEPCRVFYCNIPIRVLCEVFQSTPPSLRMRAGRLLAGKSTLAARVDSTRGDPSGNTGRVLREEIRKKIEKWQEPPPAKQPKPLPVPDSEPKKKRGGRRLRKMKER
uniref:Nop domain-containing protein n=1 Tax=Salix viminalis TaxID=40686 RepID=A0A6N2KMZ4_SALVM